MLAFVCIDIWAALSALYPLVVIGLVMEPKVEPVIKVVSVPVAVSVVIAGIVTVAAVGGPQVMFLGLDDGERIRLLPD